VQAAPTKTGLDPKILERLEELIEEVSGDYIRLLDGEEIVLSFDLNSHLTCSRTRVISIKDEGEKQITRMNFMVKTKTSLCGARSTGNTRRWSTNFRWKSLIHASKFLGGVYLIDY
jgi:hypothetical protein